MSLCEVSVIVCIYNPKMDKLKKTLDSLVNQKEVAFEIIITDDGSKNNKFQEIKEYFSCINFTGYKLTNSRENHGTVKNVLNGLKKASGKYIYLISPGDYLFDELVLHDFYCYAEENDSSVCFGNAVWYDGEKIIDKKAPEFPEFFSEKHSRNFTIMTFFCYNAILGPCYFRSHCFAEKYFNKIDNICKYVEDNTSTAWALLDGVKIDFFDRKMLYYEYGSGISTCNDSEWMKKIELDYSNNYCELKKAFPNNRIIDFFMDSKFKKIIKHPILSFEFILFKVFRKFFK